MRRPALPADLATMTPAAICRAAAYDAHEQATAAPSVAERTAWEATARRWEVEADALEPPRAGPSLVIRETQVGDPADYPGVTLSQGVLVF